MRKFTWLLILLLASSGVNSQSFREGFTEANILTEDGYYGLAIPIWLRLLKDNKDNANLNYKIGRCYLSMGLDRDRATPYLKAASKDIRKIYDPFASDFKGAPIETYYYLGKVNHINTKLDSAEYYYQKFLSGSGPKHFLKPEAKLGIEMCKTARELMADSVKVQLSNLGLSVNSSYADYTPIVSLDENTVYFTSRRARTDGSNSEFIENTTGLFFEDMYVSFRNIAGQWMEPELLGINVANKHSSVVSLSPDGQKLYIYKIFNGVGNIYQSDFELGTGWSTPSLVGSNVNSESNEYFATVTADGQRLYFVSDRRGGKGGKDIWYCQLLPNGEWGKAINAGEPINSEKDEDAPYMHPDGKTMFFSSNGHRSMGGYDILFSQKNENNEWSVPQNLGYPINTTDDDYSYVVTPDGKRAYYSSKRKNSIGSADLYLVEYIEPETKQAPIIDMSGFAVLKGWIFAPQGESLPNGIDINIAEKVSQNIVGTAKPVERNGSFVFIIPSGASYNINISLDSTLVYQEAIEVPSGTEYQELAREMFLFGQKENKPQLVAIGDEVLAKALRFRLDAMDLNQPIPLGSRVIYLDGENNAIDTAYVSKNGFFEFKILSQDQRYKLQPLVAGIDASKLQINLHQETEPLRILELVEVDSIFYEKGLEPKSKWINHRLNSYTLKSEKSVTSEETPSLQFLNKEGVALYTEKVNEDGAFIYHHDQKGTDYQIKVIDGSDPENSFIIVEMRGERLIRTIEISHNKAKPKSVKESDQKKR